MTCTHCGIWRPKDRFNVILSVSANDRSHGQVQYCADDDLCRLESISYLAQVHGQGYRTAESKPLSLGEEEQLLRRILRLAPKREPYYGMAVKCQTCEHRHLWHTTPTIKGLGCTAPHITGHPCTCIQFIPRD